MSAERAQSGSPPQVVLYQLATAHYLSRAHPRRIDQSLDGRAAATNDVNMLVNTGGRQRSEAEFHSLYDAAGFQLTRIVPTPARVSVIEGLRK